MNRGTVRNYRFITEEDGNRNEETAITDTEENVKIGEITDKKNLYDNSSIKFEKVGTV